MSLPELKRQDRRLLILMALAAENDYSISEVVLQGLLAEYGHRESSDTVRSDIAWLDEQGLVTTEQASRIVVAKITQRGIDAATGAAVIPGVRRPRPGE